ncbi:MAG TPA: DinB family protein [Gemmatimonadales bacterium]|jgi:uncharacterized damage-inducible protein DinB|nr:DinB family protein [Gemmatimonadales bacterium]
MAISDGLLKEFDHEMRNTRRTLERVPFDKAAWKPHHKSYSLGSLAEHLTVIPALAVPVLTAAELDVAAERGRHAPANSAKELLEHFDRNVAAGRSALASLLDAESATPWTLKAGDQVLWTLPRLVAFRGFIMNHMVHHRAQLGVYLRLNDVPVPGIYGPSADEKA